MGEEKGKCNSLYWGLPNQIDMKPIAFAESGSCSLTLEDSPIPWKEDAKGFNVSFDMRIPKKDAHKLLHIFGVFKQRLPRKEKKRILKELHKKDPICHELMLKLYGGRETALGVKFVKKMNL